MITDTDKDIKNNMKFISIDSPDIMEYVVNACMKSRIRGNYILRRGRTVPATNIEPINFDTRYYKYKMILVHSHSLFLTSCGTIWDYKQDPDDVIGFQID